MIRWSVPFTFVLLFAGSAMTQLPPSGFEIGHPFPTMAFRDAESGKMVSICDYRGEKVVVAIFASW